MQSTRKTAKPTHISITLNNTIGPTPEQLRLQAADLILRVLALVKKKETKKAMTRLTQLNALYRDFNDLRANYPGIEVFLKYGHFYCSNPSKLKRKALIMISLKAQPIVHQLFDRLEKYIQQYREANFFDDALTTETTLCDEEHHQFQALGNGLDALKKVMPKIIEAQEKRSAETAEQIEELAKDKEYEVISKEDAYILEQAGKAKVKELATGQNAIIRASVILTACHIGEMTRRKVTLEYGMQRVLGNYLLATEGIVVGIARHDDHGNLKPIEDIRMQAQQLLTVRNRIRERNGERRLGLVQSTGITGRKLARYEVARAGCVNTSTHSFILLFDEEYLVNGEFACSRWEFYRKPGDADIAVTGN